MLPTRSSPDVIVIGAGVIGLATALALLAKGMRVWVMERGRVGRGSAAWAAGGILGPLEPDAVNAANLPVLRDSLRLYPDWCAELKDRSGIDPEYDLSGLAVYPPLDIPAWKQMAEQCALEFRPWEGERRVGEPRPDWQLPGISQVRSPRLLQALKSAFERSGGELFEGHAVDGLIGDERVRGVTHQGSLYPSGAVVLAAGAWSAQLAPACNIEPVRGQMLALRGRPGELGDIRVLDGMYLLQRIDGLIVAGSTLESAGFDDVCDDKARAMILSAAHQLAPWLADREVLYHWSGIRPMAIDQAPLCDWASGRDGLFYNCGHYRLGITLAPGAAAVAASKIN